MFCRSSNNGHIYLFHFRNEPLYKFGIGGGPAERWQFTGGEPSAIGMLKEFEIISGWSIAQIGNEPQTEVRVVVINSTEETYRLDRPIHFFAYLTYKSLAVVLSRLDFSARELPSFRYIRVPASSALQAQVAVAAPYYGGHYAGSCSLFHSVCFYQTISVCSGCSAVSPFSRKKTWTPHTAQSL